MSDSHHQQGLATQIKNHRKAGGFSKALKTSEQALESNPPDLEAYASRWELIVEMFPEEAAKKRIFPEIESLLRTHPETWEILYTAYWGYMCFPGRARNVPNTLFDKMLQYPKTKVYLTALLGLAERSKDASQEWHYCQRVIDECTISDGPSSWYRGAYEKMLTLAEQDRSLASDDYLDELIDRCLKTHLSYCQETEQYLGWAYTDAVKWQLKFNNRLDKALETLERAESRLMEEEEQKWLVETNNLSVEEVHKDILHLRAEIYLRQERWRDAHEVLLANTPDFLQSLWERFKKESTINYFWMLGRSTEGIGDWKTARCYYADAHFAPTPHPEAQAGLKRIYPQIQRGPTDTFESFLKDAETEYRIREDADREKIRQKLIRNRLNKNAVDFRLETLEGETYTLSEMSGKVVLLDVGTSWCGPCNMVIPEIKTIYEQFNISDDVIILGINDGEAPQRVRKFLDEHQLPWPLLLDPQRQVLRAYQIRAYPSFILIDKEGNWQYSYDGSYIINGQPLIWMIEAILAD